MHWYHFRFAFIYFYLFPQPKLTMKTHWIYLLIFITTITSTNTISSPSNAATEPQQPHNHQREHSNTEDTRHSGRRPTANGGKMHADNRKGLEELMRYVSATSDTVERDRRREDAMSILHHKLVESISRRFPTRFHFAEFVHSVATDQHKDLSWSCQLEVLRTLEAATAGEMWVIKSECLNLIKL